MLSPSFNDTAWGSADAEIVDALERGAALTADEGVAIAADQGVGDRLGAGWAVEFGCFHEKRMGGERPRPDSYLAAAMESTFKLMPALSSVPITVTFLAANCSGVFWSLST